MVAFAIEGFVSETGAVIGIGIEDDYYATRGLRAVDEVYDVVNEWESREERRVRKGLEGDKAMGRERGKC